jgi:hypothetical protein
VKSLVSLGLLAAGSALGCAYYNGMWSAERLAHDALRQERNGQLADARLSWGRAAEKAESVLVHHPRSRWADDALVLQAEGLARSGDCGAAAEPLRRALATIFEPTLRERAALAGAECVLAQDSAGDVDPLLSPVLHSRDGQRRSRAAYLAGAAALARGSGLLAARLFAESPRPEAGPARLRALIQAGRPLTAIALIDSVARRTTDESQWARVLNELSRAAGPAATSAALDSLLQYGRLTVGSQARLMIADGDRLRAIRRLDDAAERYTRAEALVPDSLEGGEARVRLVLIQAARAEDMQGLDSIASQLVVLVRDSRGAAQSEARFWQREIGAIRAGDSAEVTAFRAAERARDTLDAPRLAASLFRQFATRYPTSLFAPKALIAAGQLQGIAPDSLDRVLGTQYATSPYTLAYRGANSPAFQAVEESLAIAFGVVRPNELPGAAAGRFTAPRTGPRGPAFDAPRPGGHPAGNAPRPALPEEPRRPVDNAQARSEDLL